MSKDVPSHRISTEPGTEAPARRPELVTDPAVLGAYLEDAAHYTGGHAAALALPRNEGEVSAVVRQASRVLPIGAQSSLTGGATPMGDVVLSTARLDGISIEGRSRVRVGAGVPLAAVGEALASEGLFFPPVPTFHGAFAGGVVSTNAAGAATFKYGSTRDWVQGLRLVLPSGDVLALERGSVTAHAGGYFEIDAGGDLVRVPVPTYRMPDVPKRSAGYFAAPSMDLVDLFVGSEGTLGVVTEVTFRVLPVPAATAVALVSAPSERSALTLVSALREGSLETRRTRDPRGIDVSAIEMFDRRAIDLLREDGADRQNNVTFPAGTGVGLIVQIELARAVGPDQAHAEIAGALEPNAPETPLVRLCRLFDRFGLLDSVEIAMPGDRRRAEQIFAVREAVPAGVNRRVGAAKRDVDPSIEKMAADMIVPFRHFAEMMDLYREGFEKRGLDYAIWGHVSDGNVHPNVIPRKAADMAAGREAILEFGRDVARLGGCPLAEHGVGRSPVKQTLLRQLYGDRGIDEMRRVKRALDPAWKLAPGVVFDEGW
jgi:D-lactate dehydrogenase (cytochrome)